MKLNKQSRDELRKMIEEKLKEVPSGERIRLDKDLLEKLLFEEIIYNKDNGSTVKLPIWSGKFLSKIDLSEVSFENVSWSLLCEEGYDAGYDELLDEENWYRFNGDKQKGFYIGENEFVMYEHTNAIIDFTKSWEYKVTGEIILNCCSFVGTDL